MKKSTSLARLSGSTILAAGAIILADPAAAQATQPLPVASQTDKPAPDAAVSTSPAAGAESSPVRTTTSVPVTGEATPNASTTADIIVTGQKRSERLQDVPKQVSVLSQGQLQAAGVSRLTDLQNALPQITAQVQIQNPRPPGIRGIAPLAYSIGVQAQTGLVVDDIPQSTFSTLAYNLQDVERLEVFSGPQSTLTGRNATGGIINFVTRAPSRTAEYDVSAEQTTDRQTRATAFLTGPLGSNVAYSLSLLFDKWNGNLTNALQNGKHVEGYNTKGARAKIEWDVTDRLTATATGYYIYTHRLQSPLLLGGAYVLGSPSATSVYAAPGQAVPVSQIYPGINIARGNHDVYSPENGVAETRDRGGTLRLDFRLGGGETLSSLTSYTYSTQPRTDVDFGLPRTGLTLNLTNFNAYTDLKTKYFTQEVRLASPSSSRLTYLVGAIYTDTHIHAPFYRPQVFPVNWDQFFNVWNVAAFGRGTYKVTERDSLTVGARYQYERIGYKWVFIPIAATDPNTTSMGDSGYGFFGAEASVKHDFSRDVNVYATYSRAESGKPYDLQDNGDAAKGTLQPLASTKVQNYEIGLKSQILDRRVTFNLHGFWANYSNYQIQTSTTGALSAAPVTRLLAIGKIRSRGVEIDSTVAVTRDLRLNFNGAYIDSVITDFPNAACYNYQFQVDTGCIVRANGTRDQGNLRGLTLPFSPRWKFNAGADYTVPLDKVDLNMGGLVRYQSRQHFDALGDPRTNERGYAVVNLYVGPKSHDGRWSAQLYVNNLFNTHYFALLRDLTYWSTPVVNALYDRQSFRYGGIRLTGRF